MSEGLCSQCDAPARVVKMWAELGMAMPPKLAYAVKQWTESK